MERSVAEGGRVDLSKRNKGNHEHDRSISFWNESFSGRWGRLIPDFSKDQFSAKVMILFLSSVIKITKEGRGGPSWLASLGEDFEDLSAATLRSLIQESFHHFICCRERDEEENKKGHLVGAV